MMDGWMSSEGKGGRRKKRRTRTSVKSILERIIIAQRKSPIVAMREKMGLTGM